MKRDETVDVYIGDAVSICQQKTLAAKVLGDAPDAATGHRFLASIGHRHSPADLAMSAVWFDVTGTERNRKVAVTELIVQKIVPDRVAFITKADDVIRHPVVGVDFHDVP